jgi:hypothetical protein
MTETEVDAIIALAARMTALEQRQARFEQAIRDGLMQASMASYRVSGPVASRVCWCGGQVGPREPGDADGLGCLENIYHHWKTP